MATQSRSGTSRRKGESPGKIKILMNGGSGKVVHSDSSDDEDMDDSNIPDDLPEGTVVVQPQPVNDVQAKKKKEIPGRVDSSVLDCVSCTACGRQLNPYKNGALQKHPALKVVICKKCDKFLTSGDIAKDKDGIDEQCRWCGEGGRLVVCDDCSSAFCKACVMRNFNRSEFNNINDQESWKCYLCDKSQLADLREHYRRIRDTLKSIKMKQKTKELANGAKDKASPSVPSGSNGRKAGETSSPKPSSSTQATTHKKSVSDASGALNDSDIALKVGDLNVDYINVDVIMDKLSTSTNTFREMLRALRSQFHSTSPRGADESPPMFQFSLSASMDLKTKKQRCAKALNKGLITYLQSLKTILHVNSSENLEGPSKQEKQGSSKQEKQTTVAVASKDGSGSINTPQRSISNERPRRGQISDKGKAEKSVENISNEKSNLNKKSNGSDTSKTSEVKKDTVKDKDAAKKDTVKDKDAAKKDTVKDKDAAKKDTVKDKDAAKDTVKDKDAAKKDTVKDKDAAKDTVKDKDAAKKDTVKDKDAASGSKAKSATQNENKEKTSKDKDETNEDVVNDDQQEKDSGSNFNIDDEENVAAKLDLIQELAEEILKDNEDDEKNPEKEQSEGEDNTVEASPSGAKGEDTEGRGKRRRKASSENIPAKKTKVGTANDVQKNTTPSKKKTDDEEDSNDEEEAMDQDAPGETKVDEEQESSSSDPLSSDDETPSSTRRKKRKAATKSEESTKSLTKAKNETPKEKRGGKLKLSNKMFSASKSKETKDEEKIKDKKSTETDKKAKDETGKEGKSKDEKTKVEKLKTEKGKEKKTKDEKEKSDEDSDKEIDKITKLPTIQKRRKAAQNEPEDTDDKEKKETKPGDKDDKEKKETKPGRKSKPGPKSSKKGIDLEDLSSDGEDKAEEEDDFGDSNEEDDDLAPKVTFFTDQPEEGNDEDMNEENNAAKMDLLEESDEEEKSDADDSSESSEDDEKKKPKAKSSKESSMEDEVKKDDDDDDEDKDDDDDDGNDSEENIGKKSKRIRSKLLDMKLPDSDSDFEGEKKPKTDADYKKDDSSGSSLDSDSSEKDDEESEGEDEESEEEDEEGKKKKKKGKKKKKKGKKGKGKKKGKKKGSDDEDEEDDEDSGAKKGKGKKRKRIKKMSDSSDDSDKEDKSDSDEDDDEKNKSGKRKKIRKVMSNKKLEDSTKAAAKAEEKRRKRISTKQREFNVETITDENNPMNCLITTKLILEPGKEEGDDPVVQVNKKLIRKLKPHQVEAVQFMWDCMFESVKRSKKEVGAGCILAHCMGLGKTLSVVSFVHTVLTHEEALKKRTCLVVSPLNTVLNWKNEWSLWLDKKDQLEVWELASCKQNVARAEVLKEWQESGGIMIIGYEMYRNLTLSQRIKNKRQKKIFLETLVDPGPDIVVCDEGHILKNETSAVSKAMNKMATRRRVVLTGTPLQNNLNEYHCMVSFVKPNLLGTRKEFNNRFISPIQNGQCTDSTPRDVKIMKARAHVLHEMLAGCVQRRDYSALTKFLPPKQEYVISVRMTEIQIELYEKYLELTGQGVDGVFNNKGARLFKDYQNLMKIWTHPWVLKLAEIRDEQKMKFDDEDSFIDDDSDEEKSLSSSESSSDEKKFNSDSGGEGMSLGPHSKRGTRRTRAKARRQAGEDSDPEEVIAEWKSKSRNGNDDAASKSPEVDKTVSNDWWAQFVTEEDKDNIELGNKLFLLFEILRMSEEIGDKVLIFSQSILTLNIIENFLETIDSKFQSEIDKKMENEEETTEEEGFGKSWTKNLDYYRMDGSTSAQNRQLWAQNFNDVENYRTRLFLISTKAGGLGINLVAANRVIIFDASWNPSHDVQSIFRVYRFGQIKPCYIYRFLAQGSMEEKIYERQVQKLSLSQRVVDEHQIERHFSANDLKELYNFRPEVWNEESEKITLALPKDPLLAEVLKTHRKCVVSFHEHDSLLENQIEQTLTEEEKKAAWEEYENEKKGIIFRGPGADNMNNRGASWPMMAAAQILSREQITATVQALRQQLPDLPEEMFHLHVQQALRRQVQMKQDEMRRMEMMRMQEMNYINMLAQQSGGQNMQNMAPWMQMQRLRAMQSHYMQQQNLGGAYSMASMVGSNPEEPIDLDESPTK